MNGWHEKMCVHTGVHRCETRIRHTGLHSCRQYPLQAIPFEYLVGCCKWLVSSNSNQQARYLLVDSNGYYVTTLIATLSRHHLYCSMLLPATTQIANLIEQWACGSFTMLQETRITFGCSSLLASGSFMQKQCHARNL